MLATQYAEWHKIEGQRAGESDTAFRERVSGALRDAGNIIEAHEVAQNARWDAEDGGMVQTGIAGALAMDLQGVSYGRKGSALVGDEIAAGVLATSAQQDKDPTMALLAMMLFDR